MSRSIGLSIGLLAAVAVLMVVFGSATALKAENVAVSPQVIVTGNSSDPIFEAENLGTGPGLEGISLQGKGMVGQTKFNSTKFSNRSAGVVGQDLSKKGLFNSGVRGTSTVGTGVSGSSIDFNGVSGDTSFQSTSEANKTAGVLGEDLTTVSSGTFNAGVLGTSSVGDAGVYGIGTMTYGVYGTTTFASLPFGGGGEGGVLGEEVSTDGGHGDFGVGGVSMIGTGLLGESQGFVSAEGVPPVSRYWINDGSGGYLQTGVIGAGLFGVAAFGLGASGTNYPALYLQNFNGSGLLIRANNGSSDVMSLDSAGNMILSGSLTQHGSPLQDHANRSGQTVGAYSASSTSPTIEDFGIAQLTNGVVFVRLDKAFASTINPSEPYLVFFTPEGPNNGLYVADKSAQGFSIKENPNGHSTLAVEYRIVARPLDSNGSRLPIETTKRLRPMAGRYLGVKNRRPTHV